MHMIFKSSEKGHYLSDHYSYQNQHLKCINTNSTVSESSFSHTNIPDIVYVYS